MKAYDRIAFALEKIGKPVAAHELAHLGHFQKEAKLNNGDPAIFTVTAREYIGYSEATIGRRLREMVALGRLTSKWRDGKNFKEFAIAIKTDGL